MASPGGTKGEESTRKDVRRKLEGPPREVAQILYNLAKTSRSFGFYHRDNKAIENFTKELFDGFEAFLTTHGAIRLGVGADRFTFHGDEVYHDADRENGMPFRLFRDGVRAIQFKPGLTRPEMDEILDILSKRGSTGRAAEEDDLVTLLWQKSFEHITYVAVEGFTHDLHAAGSFDDDGRPQADSGEAIPRMLERISGQRETLGKTKRQPGPTGRGKPGGGRVMSSFRDDDAEQMMARELAREEAKIGGRNTPVRSSSETAQMMPVDEVMVGDGTGFGAVQFAPGLYPGARDYPLKLRGGMVEVQYQPLEFEEIDLLRQELREDSEIGLLHLLDYCFELTLREPEFFGVEDFRAILTPVRRYLVRQRDLQTYDRLLRYLRKVAAGGVYPQHLTTRASEMLSECSGGEALGQLVAAASGDEEAENLAWDILQQLLPSLEPDEILALLGHGMTEHMANILAGTLIRRTGTSLAIYESALKQNSVPTALAALRCLATLRTPKAIAVVERAIRWESPVVRRAVARIVGRVPATPRTARTLRQALEDPAQEVRDEALKAIDRQGTPALAQLLWRWFVDSGFKLSDSVTRPRCVTLVAELDEEFATRVLSEKLNVNIRARMGGLVGKPEVIEWNRLAVAGLAAAATPAAIEKLREVRTQGDDSFREFVTRNLVEARKKAAGE